MPKIALYGYMRSGKDSVAEILKRDSFGAYERVAFGDELKRHYHAIFGNAGIKDREGYQWFGQTMRQRKSSVWLDVVDAKIDTLADWGIHNIVITDLRQPNEYEYCRQNGFHIVKVDCPLNLRIERMRKAGDVFKEADLDHETESHYDSFDPDFVIVNDADEAHLFYETFKVWEAIHNG